MKKLILFLTVTAFVVLTGASCAENSVKNAPPKQTSKPERAAKKTLRRFNSEQELAGFFREYAEAQKKALTARQESASGTPLTDSTTSAANTSAESKSETPSAKDDESVTNVQHAGVDEGGIVKLHGNHLVVLRRGRLFTVEIGDGALKPVSAIDAFAPDIDPTGTWYDEMLLSDDTIAVIGYSYERGGTEIGLFNINAGGRLSYRATYHLRSNDYYSSRNYASRLVGGKLVFYTPQYLPPGAKDPLQEFPAVRKWHKGAKDDEFRRIVAATRVYRAEQQTGGAYGLALHTVTVCDLKGDFTCEGTAVIGPPGSVFYVSPESVYVWTSEWGRARQGEGVRSMVYRMPLDGSGPSALGASGSPVDQFSFLESDDAHLNVLVRSSAVGAQMWGAEVAEGDVSLMRVPLASFSDGSEAAPSSSYQQFPKPDGYTFQNRFVGDYLLYGAGSGWGLPEKAKEPKLYVARWAGGGATELSLTHGVDRIEAMGSDAVVVGTDGKDLHFTSVRLGERPSVASTYTRKGATQGELRSHGFFYKPDGPDSGLLGLPVRGPERPGYEHLFEESASLLFLRNESLGLKELGELDARPEKAVNDACRASCVDWYGNARPLFVRGRIFALLGYEIVEGKLAENRIQETRRINYAPQRLQVTSR